MVASSAKPSGLIEIVLLDGTLVRMGRAHGLNRNQIEQQMLDRQNRDDTQRAGALKGLHDAYGLRMPAANPSPVEPTHAAPSSDQAAPAASDGGQEVASSDSKAEIQ